MGLHENKKMGKIIDEMIIYLMDKKINDIKIHITNDEITTIIEIKFLRPDDVIIDCIKQELHFHRERELEEYGWELLGEDDHSCEMNLVGILVDEVIYQDREGYFSIRLIRNKS